VGCCAKTAPRLLRRIVGLKLRRRPRAPLRVALLEREENSRGLLATDSSRVIARRLGRAPSTESRDVAANGGKARHR